MSSSQRPIFVLTHPRACSTAFERVFMTRTDILRCAHEPFGDAFYYGPERTGERYADDEAGRLNSGFSKTTYKDVLDRLERDGSDGKRVFIKDMAYYLMPPNHETPSIAPSLRSKDAHVDGEQATNGEKPTNGHNGTENGVAHLQNGHTNGHANTNGMNGHSSTTNGVNGANGTNGYHSDTSNHTNGTNGHTNGHANGHTNGHTNGHANGHTNGQQSGGSDGTGNPTVLPLSSLSKFHWTFLIRHPRRSIPSYVRCCSPPLSATTGWDHFKPSEAGYSELRRVFDYLLRQGIIGDGGVEITVLDADELLDRPEEAVRAFCERTGIEFDAKRMLAWGDDDEGQRRVADAFRKWDGWHNDAISSKGLTARKHPLKPITQEAEEESWREKYGEEGFRIIKAAVEENTPDYDYLKSFAMKF